MKKTIHISIPEPCHEDWAKMTPTQKGRHCASCEKEVTDYTQKTDEQLVKLLSNTSKSCGRFKKSQINREVTLERKSSQALAPFAASLLIPLSLLSSLNAKGSTTENNTEKTYKSIGIGRLSNTLKTQVTTKGIIVDRNGKPLNKVKVYVKETGKATFSDHKGAFSIISLSEQTIIFEKLNYLTEIFNTKSRSETINLTLNDEKITSFSLGEPMTIGTIRALQPSIDNNSINKKEIIDTLKVEEKQQLNATTKLIKGTITDSSLLPLPGVNIIIKGTTIGTQSDFDGNYTIGVTKGQTLVYSYVGFETEERNIDDLSYNVNLSLVEGLTGEIVITGGFNYSEPKRMVTKPDFYANEEEVSIRRKRYKNTLAFLKLKIARKKEARKTKRAKRKALKSKRN